jgi:hypothetical protein
MKWRYEIHRIDLNGYNQIYDFNDKYLGYRGTEEIEVVNIALHNRIALITTRHPQKTREQEFKKDMQMLIDCMATKDIEMINRIKNKWGIK